MSFKDINAAFLKRGYFLPVSPGTQFVTLGGAVAADIHGKNHHIDGCFGRHVTSLKMRLADGDMVTCSPTQKPELFQATVGGMGLTGNILEVSFAMVRIPSPWIFQESERVSDIESYVEKLAEAATSWPMTVGWIDCVRKGASGRGILIKGRWATPDEAPTEFPSEPLNLRVPFELPEWALSESLVRVFNFAYYWKHLPQKTQGVVSPYAFFYPLDFVKDWNLGYGPRGLTQYQCVLPRDLGPSAVRRLVELVAGLGGASPLCVIKDCGTEGEGLLTFPKPGISIAIDLPVRSGTPAVVGKLNERVIADGGRIYLAKDAFTTSAHFQAMEGARLVRFREARDRYDPRHLFRSAQSVRLMGDAR